MSDSNFTPLSSKKPGLKKKTSTFKLVGLISSFVLFFGVIAGYFMVQNGVNFFPKAGTANKGLDTYGWNGQCFTNLDPASEPPIILANRYQCPGPISKYGSGCDATKPGGKKTATWVGASLTNGTARVCISNGADGPKDANGCFTQQLDLGDNKDRVPPDGFGREDWGPEGFYSFDRCATTSTPTEPKPGNPKPEPTQAPLPTPEPTPGKTDVYAACIGTTGTEATVQWTHVPGATQYAYRLNYRDNDSPSCAYGWYCSEPPDVLIEAEKNFTGTGVNFTVIPGHTYDFWVHPVQNGVSGPSALTSFTCSSAAVTPGVTETPTPTVEVPTPTTVTSCPVPKTPTNVRVSCPTCSAIGGSSQQIQPTVESTATPTTATQDAVPTEDPTLSPTTEVTIIPTQ